MIADGVFLVTGGAGFIGSFIVDALVEAGAHVRVIDRLLPQAHARAPGYLNEGAEYVYADLNDGDALEGALDGVTAVSHQASMVGLGTDLADITDYVHHNDAGTAALLGALHHRRFDGRLVLGSSMVVYGEGGYACETDGPVRPSPRSRKRLEAGRFEPTCPTCDRELVAEPVVETALTDPRNVYAATKLHQEHLCAAFSRESRASVVALRYHNVYGPRMPQSTPYAGVASIFRSAIEAGHPPRVFEDGRQIRDFVHVTDIAAANLKALDVSSAPGVYNIASGDPRSVKDMADALASAARKDLPPIVTGEYRLGDVRHVFASIDRARRDLGYVPGVSFEDGIRDFADAPLREPPEPAV